MILETSGQMTPQARAVRRGGAFWMLLVLGMAALPLQAGEGGGVATLANREVTRREAMRQQAQSLVDQGAAAESKSDYVEAMKDYKAAYDMLPSAPMTASLKTAARNGYSRAANAQARLLAGEARYDEARQLLATVLADDFDPDNAKAKLFLKQLDDPDRFEPALTPEHKQKVDKVTFLLRQAQSYLNLGDLDNAMEKYKDVIRLDAYNTAARRGMEKVELERTHYFDAARDQHRAKMLNDVSQGWEDPVPVLDVSQLFGGGAGTPAALAGSHDSILQKLRTWIVPMVDLQDASLDEVVEFLRIRSRDIDPQKKGISFVLRVPDSKTKTVKSLQLTQVPLEELLRYVTEMTGTAYHADEYAVTITSLTEQSTTMIERYYRVPPDFIANSPVAEVPDTAAPANPFAKGAAPGQPASSGLVMHRLSAKEFLEQRGVAFPEGSTAIYNSGTSMLVVRNTLENLTAVESLVDQARTSAPKQVEIIVRLINMDQTNMDEMGFDWLLGQANVPGSSSVFFSGGTTAQTSSSGTATSTATADYPFTYPGGTTPVGQDSVTSGLRSSGAISGVPSIDSLIQQGGTQTPTAPSKSPGVFSIAGVFTDPQFQMVIRALAQKKGTDLLAAPSVVTKSGQRATVVVARELLYPTEFNPPQIPTTLATVVPSGVGGGTIFGGSKTAPVTPTTPTAFTMRNVGITLEVEPVVDANNRLVHLNVVPSDTEFEGFVNYGSDITTFANNIPYNQPNHILQPIFRSTKSNTSVDVWDGQTVMLAGVVSENRTDIEDKVPFIGSLPLIGRLFQSKVTQTDKKNVAFFVTVRIIDPGGSPVNTVAPSAATPVAPPVAAAAP